MAVAKPTPPKGLFCNSYHKTHPSEEFILQWLSQNLPFQRVHFEMAIAKPTPPKGSFATAVAKPTPPKGSLCDSCHKTYPSEGFIL
jgi:hypothetical protein